MLKGIGDRWLPSVLGILHDFFRYMIDSMTLMDGHTGFPAELNTCPLHVLNTRLKSRKIHTKVTSLTPIQKTLSTILHSPVFLSLHVDKACIRAM